MNAREQKCALHNLYNVYYIHYNATATDASIHANAEILPQIRPQPHPSTSFPIHNSLLIQSLNAIYSELLKA
jgi:hypothetical protein